MLARPDPSPGRHRRRRRRYVALALIVLSPLPAALAVYGSLTPADPPDVPVPPTASTLRIPFHAGSTPHGYEFFFEAAKPRTGGQIVECLLRFQDPPYGGLPNPCLGIHDRVSFRWTLDSGGKRLTGGRYGDELPFFAPSSSDTDAEGEFAWPNEMPAGDDVLELTGLHVPLILASDRPRIHITAHLNAFDFDALYRLFGGLIASGVLAVSAAIVAVWSIPFRKRDRAAPPS